MHLFVTGSVVASADPQRPLDYLRGSINEVQGLMTHA
jgi:hypothetical protein